MNQFSNRPGMGMQLMPPMIKKIIYINIAVFILEFIIFDNYIFDKNINLSYFGAIFSMNSPLYDSYIPYTNELRYLWQPVTYQFMHGDFMHIFFNLFVLWMIGSEMERIWGPKRFLIFYLLSGVFSGFVHILYAYFANETLPLVGASGSIYAVLIAFALTFPDRKLLIFPFFFPVSAKYLAMILIALDLLGSFVTFPNDKIAHFGHLGGALAGYLLWKWGDDMGIFKFFGRFFPNFGSRPSNFGYSDSYSEPQKKTRVYKMNWKSDKEVEYTQKADNSKTEMNIDGEKITQERIDQILDKISAEGYQNLSEKEKRILFELSQKLK